MSPAIIALFQGIFHTVAVGNQIDSAQFITLRLQVSNRAPIIESNGSWYF